MWGRGGAFLRVKEEEPEQFLPGGAPTRLPPSTAGPAGTSRCSVLSGGRETKAPSGCWAGRELGAREPRPQCQTEPARRPSAVGLSASPTRCPAPRLAAWSLELPQKVLETWRRHGHRRPCVARGTHLVACLVSRGGHVVSSGQ